MTNRSRRADAALPRLAFVHSAHSFPTLEIVEAARGLCELIWVIDSQEPGIGNLPRLLERTGTLVDTAGLQTVDAAQAIAKERPAGILTLADRLLEKTAALAEGIGRPFLSPGAARALADKHTQRTALRAAGLSVPGFELLTSDMTVDEWLATAERITFPAVLKPRRGEGSKDTYSIRGVSDLRETYDTLRERGLASRDYVLEELIGTNPPRLRPGGFADYVSVESVACDGRITHLAVTGRTPLAEPFRETGLFIPAMLDAPDRAAVLDLAARAARAVGVESGCLHTEIKLTDDGPVVIEVNGRMGGILPAMLRSAFGIEIIPIAMRLALGQRVTLTPMPRTDKVVYRIYVQPPTGASRVADVSGLDEMRAHSGVTEVTLKRWPGHAVNWRDGSQGYVLNVSGATPDRQSFGRTREAINRLVDITWE